MNDVIIYTDNGRFAVIDNALYEESSRHGLRGLIFEIESFVTLDDGSVIVRGDDFNVSGAERMISLGIVRDSLEMTRVT